MTGTRKLFQMMAIKVFHQHYELNTMNLLPRVVMLIAIQAQIKTRQ